MNLPEIGATYTHYKNHKNYTVLCVALHSETQERLVVYQAQYDNPELGTKPIFARPVEMFMEDVIVDGQSVPRFKQL